MTYLGTIVWALVLVRAHGKAGNESHSPIREAIGPSPVHEGGLRGGTPLGAVSTAWLS